MLFMANALLPVTSEMLPLLPANMVFGLRGLADRSVDVTSDATTEGGSPLVLPWGSPQNAESAI